MNADKKFDKTQPTFMIKTLSKLGIKGKFLKLIKHLYKNLQKTTFLRVKCWKLSLWDRVWERNVH